MAFSAIGIAVYAALCGADSSEVLSVAANHDGDNDSTASIAGQIYGVWQGAGGLPQRWVQRLDVMAPLNSLTTVLARHTVG